MQYLLKPHVKYARRLPYLSSLAGACGIEIDVVCAFRNADVPEPMFHVDPHPDGYGRKGYVLELYKALYGLPHSRSAGAVQALIRRVPQDMRFFLHTLRSFPECGP